MAFNGIQPSLSQFHKYLNLISFESDLLSTQKKVSSEPTNTHISEAQHQQIEEGYTCWVDGSWHQHWLGGVGLVLERNGELHIAKSSGVKASCAAQAEAIALLQAVQYATDNGITSCKFYTDSQTLSQAVQAWQPPLLVDWRSFKEIFEIWKRLKINREFVCQHISRSHNEMADLLACKGTKENWSFECYTYPLLGHEVGLG